MVTLKTQIARRLKEHSYVNTNTLETTGPETQPQRLPRFLYGAVTLLSAFLLFQVQLIISKYILPWFGGTASVWTTCVLFFQIMLLLGYSYTHLTKKLGGDLRFRVHAGLLTIAVALLIAEGLLWRSPITPSMTHLLSPDRPTLSVLIVLFVTAGLPFWLLSTTSPLLQDWFWQIEGRSPYRLYALSNLGSLVGLLTYPFLFEPLTTVFRQGWLWTSGFILFAAGAVTCGWAARATVGVVEPGKKKQRLSGAARLRRGDIAMWVALAGTGSALMLATTNFLTQDVASVPLLWVVPLSTYLISFIFTFENDRFYRRWIIYPLLPVGLAATSYALERGIAFPIRGELWIVNLTLLIGTAFCHGELARSKPAPEMLTRFYLWIAVGGVLGSGFVALLAPHIFAGVWEFQYSLGAVAVLGIVVLLRDRNSWPWRTAAWRIPAATALIGLVPLIAVADILNPKDSAANNLHWIALGLVAALAAFLFTFRRLENLWWARASGQILMFTAPLVLGSILWQATQYTTAPLVTRSRNFYGVLSLHQNYEDEQVGWIYILFNGRTLHGIQSLKPELQSRASTYYGNVSGVGLALLHHLRLQNPDPQQRNLRVGVVGMGAGTVLVYAFAGDYFRVYELNPGVADLSQGPHPYFTYLRNCRGTCEVVIGDARTSLQREAETGNLQKFDVLVLDAFSGDAIPIHLLTREAFELYLRHLRDDQSIIAVHISNNVLDLSPIVARIASALNLNAVRVKSPAQGTLIRPSDWVLLSRRNPPLDLPPDIAKSGIVGPAGKPGPLWTDSFSNLLSVIK